MFKSVPRRELILITSVVLVAAVFFRWLWIPLEWPLHLIDMEEKLSIPVSHVGMWFSAWTIGDGQAFALIASDPLAIDFGEILLVPGYRYQRAGFSWLVWLVTFGHAAWIPYGMAFVSVISLVAALLIAIRLRPKLGQSAWLIVLNPAVFVGFAGDTAETLGVVFLALAMALNSRWASVALGFTRPSFLVALVSRWRLLWPGAVAALALFFYGVTRFGFDPTDYPRALSLPFVGYVEAPNFGSILLLSLSLATVFFGVRYRNLSWVISGVFVLCFSMEVLNNPINAWRTAGLIPVLWAFGPAFKPGMMLAGFTEERNGWTFLAKSVPAG